MARIVGVNSYPHERPIRVDSEALCALTGARPRPWAPNLEGGMKNYKCAQRICLTIRDLKKIEGLLFLLAILVTGLTLRSDKRKLRALDSADGQAPRPARKGICF